MKNLAKLLAGLRPAHNPEVTAPHTEVQPPEVPVLRHLAACDLVGRVGQLAVLEHVRGTGAGHREKCTPGRFWSKRQRSMALHRLLSFMPVRYLYKRGG
eukprot:CAMPEP_0202912106 /NCGR_PEP_ID=MMETSP1392-20130828/56851_1 /ASSEMBLY_ACC=CAM_ASM_000868 /TAXON_ID=225041 /ORGANISM="Chlamydomonas chlamydogama, Strain SAG 11-48b" /LENGTH=98 /DNA_ID=CAMNT_0049602899 /DNA_START=39 /DNA_END=335 /DNA_ORIENTATION=-